MTDSWTLTDGTILVFDEERSKVRTHGTLREAVPTLTLFIVKGGQKQRGVSTDIARRAAAQIYGLRVVVTSNQVELSTIAAVGSLSDAKDLAGEFVNEYIAISDARERAASASRPQTSHARTR